MAYKDMTFCTFHGDCELAHTCSRPLTEEVQRAAEEWWGSDEAPVSVFRLRPTCYSRSWKPNVVRNITIGQLREEQGA